MYELISRQEANNKGLTRYFTGKACKHGHICKAITLLSGAKLGD